MKVPAKALGEAGHLQCSSQAWPCKVFTRGWRSSVSLSHLGLDVRSRVSQKPETDPKETGKVSHRRASLGYTLTRLDLLA